MEGCFVFVCEERTHNIRCFKLKEVWYLSAIKGHGVVCDGRETYTTRATEGRVIFTCDGRKYGIRMQCNNYNKWMQCKKYNI